jgi:hypothetical protein
VTSPTPPRSPLAEQEERHTVSDDRSPPETRIVVVALRLVAFDDDKASVDLIVVDLDEETRARRAARGSNSASKTSCVASNPFKGARTRACSAS